MSAITTIISRSRWVATLVVVASALAIVPAAASASTTTFGSSLNHSPANAGNTCAQDGVVNGPALCTHVGSFYPGTSGRARSPVSGTITKIRLLAEGPTTLVVKVVQVRNVSSDHMHGQAKAIAKSRTLHVQGTMDANGNALVESFNVQLKVQKGDELAVDTTSNTAEYCADGTPGQLLFDPILSIGHGFRSAAGVDGCLMLVQAVVKH
jgi:hypothetical protein